jgi:hypothetical protein
MNRAYRSLLLASFFFACSFTLLSQQPPPDMKLNPASVRRVIHAVLEQIGQKYAFPDVGQRIVTELGVKVDRGDYDAVTTALDLVPRINRDLRAIAHDNHLNFGYTADAADPNTDEDSPELRDKARLLAAKSNFGINQVECLPGNIGYIDYRKFHDPAFGAEPLASAFSLVANTRALIIDLRNNTGGDLYGPSFLASYFVRPAPVKFSELYFRTDNGVRQLWTLAYVPGPRYLGRPVYILTSAKTFSAAEGFSHGMQHLHLASIVGQKTRGGANPAVWIVIDPHFAVQVPIGHPADLESSWEGVGVTPDVAVASDLALDTAKLLAWKEVLARTQDLDEATQLRDLISATEKH